MSDLDTIVMAERAAAEAKRAGIAADRDARGTVAASGYVWQQLDQLISDAVRRATGFDDVQIQLGPIARDKFDGDVVLKVPSLLKKGGPKRFIAEFQPAIVAALEDPALSSVIKKLSLAGMYINITLADEWLLRTADQVAELGDRYGETDALAGQGVVIDYSSPNVAKVLHAGHIRSTITGHVLGNLYDACGATVYRVNHINDFGGFGFILEGYRRFYDLMPADATENDRLLAIYGIRRTLERVVGAEDDAAWDAETSALMQQYFPGVTTRDAAVAALADFTAASDARFDKLESGDPDETALWQKMVGWSLEAFQDFYRHLNIDIDFVLGESFYYRDGMEVIERALADGSAIVFTEDLAEAELAEVARLRAADELSEGEAEIRIQGIKKDIGATIAQLPSGERFVLLRSDGHSIYATRDIGAIYRRNQLFDPAIVEYVVGQEQRAHFQRLFATAEVLGLVTDGKPKLEHLSFGFYVDQSTGKKLSSRASVANVMTLLEMSEEYFRTRMSERGNQSEAERNTAAKELSIGSLVFNDLKQDIKGSVEIDVSSLENTINGFEKSGGAYVVYSACRARSILRRHGKAPRPVDEIGAFELSDQEVDLLLKLQQTPARVNVAATTNNPTEMIRHALDVAMAYNSWYMNAPVLGDDGPNEARLLITNAVYLVLRNVLALCHITCPESI